MSNVSSFLPVLVATIILLFSSTVLTLSSSWISRPPLVNSRAVLYNINDPNIIYLDAENFESYLNSPGREHIVMVQFYIDWAEGSKKVIPTYSNLARNISTWENVIRLAAINCAEERNVPVCREYGYIAYPAFKLFPPANLMTSSDQGNNSFIQLIEYNTINRKTHKLMPIILDYIDKLSINKRNHHDSWPNFAPIKVDSLNELENLFSNQTKDTTILLLIDRDTGDTNRKILMDMSVYQANLIIRRIQVSSQLSEQLAKDKSSEPILLYTTTGKDGKSSLKLVSLKDIGGYDRELITKYIETHFASLIRIKRMDPIFMGDLYKGLRHSLYNEVTLHKNLNSSQIAALASYISVIYRYFPFDNENPRRFFKRMDSWMRIRKPGKLLESIDLLAIMRVGSEGFIPQTDHYHYCKSGYPCSLWLIFHTLTVSEYLKPFNNKAKTIETINKNNSTINIANSNNNTVTTETNTTSSKATTLSKMDENGKHQQSTSRKKHQVLYAMRDYVKYFYSCADCKQQFTSMVADLEDRLIEQNSSILTLWEIHNNISESISRQESTSTIIRSPWPTRKTCPRCYTPADNWDTREVFNFLINHYSKDRMVKLRNTGPPLCSNLSSSPVFLSSLIVTLLLNLSIY